VALGFSLAEATVLLYIFARDSRFDRANSIFHVPLVLQELVQALLWPHVGESSQACDEMNRALSLLITAVVVGVPLYFVLIALASQAALQASLDAQAQERLGQGFCRKGHRMEAFETEVLHYFCSVCGTAELPLRTRLLGCRSCDFDACTGCVEAAAAAAGTKPPRWAQLLLGRQPSLWASCMPGALRRTTKLLAFVNVWWWFLAILFMHRRIYGKQSMEEESSIFDGPRCTTRGPYGHQVWPMMVWGRRWWAKLCCALLYFTFGGGYVFIPKPSYLPIAFNALAFVAVTLYLLMGDEWGSVWCWLASCLCGLYLVEPFLFQRFRVFDPDVLQSPLADPRRHQFGFWAARVHWLPMMLPWAAVLERVAAEARAAGASSAAAGLAVQRAASGHGPWAQLSAADISAEELAEVVPTAEQPLTVPPGWRPGLRPGDASGAA